MDKRKYDSRHARTSIPIPPPSRSREGPSTRPLARRTVRRSKAKLVGEETELAMPRPSIAAAMLALGLAACSTPAASPPPTPDPPAQPAPAPAMLGTPGAHVLADRPRGAAWRSFGPSQVLAPTGPRRMLDADPGAPIIVPFTAERRVDKGD